MAPKVRNPRQGRHSQRAKLLRVALAAAELSGPELAKRFGVSNTQFGEVVRGKRQSARLDALIDDFIQKHHPAPPRIAA